MGMFMSADKPKTALFLAKQGEDAEAARNLFVEEARKSEVYWDARSGSFSDLQEAALTGTDLVVLLQGLSDADLRKQFPSWKGDAESWKINSAADDVDALKQHISILLVRLIMKGGKRAPIPVVIDPAKKELSKSDKANAKVRVCLETKGRKGKKVTTINGLPLDDDELEKLCVSLKQSCGTGGTTKDGVIEIQGDQCKKILEALQKLGYRPKRAGG